MIKEMTDAEYFARSELSQSGCKTLLLPAGPARFQWERTHGRPDTAAFDFGHAAHLLALGKGLPVAIYDKADLAVDGTAKTKAAREFAEAARGEGKVPIKPSAWRTLQDMAGALQANPRVAELLRPEGARVEVAMTATLAGDVPFRGKLDVLTPTDGLDYKTSASIADADGFARIAYRYAYDMQAAAYLWLMRENGYEAPRFMFVVQEKDAPYLSAAYELDSTFLDIGHQRLLDAFDIYRRCTKSGEWPGYTDDITLVPPPIWAIDDDIEIGA